MHIANCSFSNLVFFFFCFPNCYRIHNSFMWHVIFIWIFKYLIYNRLTITKCCQFFFITKWNFYTSLFFYIIFIYKILFVYFNKLYFHIKYIMSQISSNSFISYHYYFPNLENIKNTFLWNKFFFYNMYFFETERV